MNTNVINERMNAKNRILIHEDSLGISRAEEYVTGLAHCLTKVLIEFNALETSASISISDLLAISSASPESVENFIKDKILSASNGEAVFGGIKIDRLKLKSMMEIPSLKRLLASIEEVKEYRSNDFAFRQRAYEGITGFRDFIIQDKEVKFDQESFEKFCDVKLRIYARTEKELEAFKGVTKIVELLNEVVAPFENNIHNPSQARSGYWTIERNISKVFKFNTQSEKFELNHEFFK